MSLIYTFARFLSFRPYTARSRSFYVRDEYMIRQVARKMSIPEEESTSKLDIGQVLLPCASAASHLSEFGQAGWGLVTTHAEPRRKQLPTFVWLPFTLQSFKQSHKDMEGCASFVLWRCWIRNRVVFGRHGGWGRGWR